jgi:hypothetical protein
MEIRLQVSASKETMVRLTEIWGSFFLLREVED